jgi:hypothetical protein
LNAVRRSLVDGATALAVAFARPGIYALVLAALALWALAYQIKQPYIVQVADMAYHPYIEGFNAIETRPDDPTDRYRWSTGSPSINIPGVGNQSVVVSLTTVGARPLGTPPAIDVESRGQRFTVQTTTEQRTDSFVLERGDPFDGDIRLRMSVPSFTPEGDPRELGVIIRRVEIAPASYDLRPVVVPSLSSLGGLLAGVVGIYALLVVTVRRSRLALVLAGAAALLGAAGVAFARPDTAFLAGQLPSLWLWTLGLGFLGRAVLDVALGDSRRCRYAVAAGSLAFAIAFAVRFGGLTNAQFLTSDLILHVHNVQSVLQGELVFTEPVPDGTLVPYPPAYYVLVGALSWLFGQTEEVLGLLLKWSASVLDALTCLALAWAGARVWSGSAGALAALAYAASPAAFDLFSAGNYTNIFGQSVLNLTLLPAVAYLAARRGQPSTRVALAWLTLGFGLTMLGHYGMMLAALAILALYLLWALVAQAAQRCPPRVWVVLGSGGLALGASFAAYYWRLADLIFNQWGGVLARLTGGGAATEQSRPGILESLARLPGRLGALVGWHAVIAGLVGLIGARGLQSGARALLWCWLAAALVLAMLDQVVGDAVRWYYLAAAGLALPAGAFLGRLAQRRSSGLLFAVLALAAMAWHALTFWVDLIFTRYH